VAPAISTDPAVLLLAGQLGSVSLTRWPQGPVPGLQTITTPEQLTQALHVASQPSSGVGTREAQDIASLWRARAAPPIPIVWNVGDDPWINPHSDSFDLVRSTVWAVAYPELNVIRQYQGALFQQGAHAQEEPVARFHGAQWGAGTWRNLPIRLFWMLMGVTPVHETGHVVAGLAAGQDPRAGFRDTVYRGKVSGLQDWPLLAGILTNLITVPLLMTILGVGLDFNVGHLSTAPAPVFLSYLAAIHWTGAAIEFLAPDGDFARFLSPRQKQVRCAA